MILNILVIFFYHFPIVMMIKNYKSQVDVVIGARKWDWKWKCSI